MINCLTAYAQDTLSTSAVNTNIRVRLSMVDLLIKVACFVKIMYCLHFAISKAAMLVSTRRSTVLSHFDFVPFLFKGE